MSRYEIIQTYVCSVCSMCFDNKKDFNTHYDSEHMESRNEIEVAKLTEDTKMLISYIEENFTTRQYGTYSFAIFIDKAIWGVLNDDFRTIDNIETLILKQLGKIKNGQSIVEAFYKRDKDYTKAEKMYADFKLKDL